MTIADLGASGKTILDRIPSPWLIAGIVILSSSASFGLGILEGRGGNKSALQIEELATTTPAGALGAAAYTAPAAAATAAIPASAPTSIPAGGEVVASKNGSKYYLPWCGGAKLIKDENKVWFPTRDAAEAAGYQPAANCKGL
jgi:hypothetical protein